MSLRINQEFFLYYIGKHIALQQRNHIVSGRQRRRPPTHVSPKLEDALIIKKAGGQ